MTTPYVPPTPAQAHTLFERIVKLARRQSIEQSELFALIHSAAAKAIADVVQVPVPPYVPKLATAYEQGQPVPSICIATAWHATQWTGRYRRRVQGTNHPYADAHAHALEVLARMAKDLRGGTFGSRLIELRINRGWTQLELAVAMRVSPSTIREWEHDRAQPQRGRLTALCHKLHCSKADLLGY
jgi:DNA-binding XRE family transcriptional regulator